MSSKWNVFDKHKLLFYYYDYSEKTMLRYHLSHDNVIDLLNAVGQIFTFDLGVVCEATETASKTSCA